MISAVSSADGSPGPRRTEPVSWTEARESAYRAGLRRVLPPMTAGLVEAEGHVLAEDVRALTDLPAFPASRVDGYAVRGPVPWQLLPATLTAGAIAEPLGRDGVAVGRLIGRPQAAATLDGASNPDNRLSTSGSVR